MCYKFMPLSQTSVVELSLFGPLLGSRDYRITANEDESIKGYFRHIQGLVVTQKV